MKQIILSGLLFTAAIVQSQTNWNVDASHSKLGFSVMHMMVTETDGKIKVYEGSVASKSETDFTDAKINFSANVNSINTDDEKRDGHLKSADFFDAEKYPNITFVATSMKPNPKKGKTAYDLEGDLTMKGVTKRVKLFAIGSSAAVKDPYGNTKFGFKVTGEVNRKDFGLNWNAVLESGGVVVSEMVNLDIKIELNKAKV
ncbi:MAG: YceI family protein [Sphingobacteriaceae bacterium]|nr:YceI family protein [Sphingobacteriaceae bacterium]